MKHANGGKVGRINDEAKNVVMEEIFNFIENIDDCQFTLKLKDICKCAALVNRRINGWLNLKYGDKIIVTEKSTCICFVDNHHDILNQSWYEKKPETCACYEEHSLFNFLNGYI